MSFSLPRDIGLHMGGKSEARSLATTKRVPHSSRLSIQTSSSYKKINSCYELNQKHRMFSLFSLTQKNSVYKNKIG